MYYPSASHYPILAMCLDFWQPDGEQCLLSIHIQDSQSINSSGNTKRLAQNGCHVQPVCYVSRIKLHVSLEAALHWSSSYDGRLPWPSKASGTKERLPRAVILLPDPCRRDHVAILQSSLADLRLMQRIEVIGTMPSLHWLLRFEVPVARTRVTLEVVEFWRLHRSQSIFFSRWS